MARHFQLSGESTVQKNRLEGTIHQSYIKPAVAEFCRGE